MRLILTILLIGLFKADAQIVINASSPYKPMVSANLLLDDYPNAAAAYSLRKLDKDYTGSAIRVRKDTTGQPEQDIGFTASGGLDTAALKSFLNARSGFITRWYDQSGNSRNATQATQANQPRIALTGVIDRRNNNPCIFFNRTNSNWMSNGYTDTDGFSVFGAINVIGNSTTNDRIGVFYTNGFEFARITTNYGFQTNPQFSAVVTTSPSVVEYATSVSSFSANTSYTIYGNWNGNNTVVRYRRNGIDNTNSGVSGSTLRTGITSPIYYSGYFFEAIIYPNDQHSNRSFIETNINTYWSIY